MAISGRSPVPTGPARVVTRCSRRWGGLAVGSLWEAWLMGGTSRIFRSALKRLAWAGIVLSLMAVFGMPTAAFAAASTVTLAGDPGTVTVTADDLANGIGLNDSARYVTVVDTI